MPLLNRAPVVQNCYVVNDLREACKRYNEVYGVGPFFVFDHIQLVKNWYRGKEAPLDISAAFVQSGDLNIEFIQQHNDGPSCYRDMFKPGEEGFHHTAIFCKDYDAEKKAFEAAGFPIANEFQTSETTFLCYTDTRKALGHMIELYQDHQGVRGMYAMIREAAENWDGRDVFKNLG